MNKTQYEAGLEVTVKEIAHSHIKIKYVAGACPCADLEEKTLTIPPMNGLGDEEVMKARGFFYHESLHIRHTTLKERPKGLLGHICNTLEDIRIESLGGNEFKGVGQVFNQLNSYFNVKLENNKRPPINEALVAMSFKYRGLVPAWDLSEKACDIIEKCYGEFIKVSGCKDTDDVLELSKVIEKLIREQKEEEQKDKDKKEDKEKNKGSGDKSDKDKSEGEGNTESENDDNKSESNDSDNNESEDSGDNKEDTDSEETESKDGTEEDSDDESKEGDSDEGTDDNKEDNESEDSEENSTDNNTSSSGGEIDDKAKHEIGKEGKPTKSKEQKELEEKIDEMIKQEFDETEKTKQEQLKEEIEKAITDLDIENPNRYKSLTEHDFLGNAEKGNLNDYNTLRQSIKSSIMGLSNSLNQALRTMALTHKDNYKYAGKLDMKRLVAIGKSLDDKVFFQTRPGMKLDTCVSILIDLSGSMGDRPMRQAQLLAIALGECLTQLNIPFEMIGHTTSGYHEYIDEIDRTIPLYMPIYKGFNENWQVTKARTTTMRNREQNVDGECLDIMASRIANRKEKRKIIMVLSDGEPACGRNDDRLCLHLKEVVKKIWANGMECYGFGICSNCTEYYGKENSLIVKDVSKLDSMFMKRLVEIVTRGKFSTVGMV